MIIFISLLFLGRQVAAQQQDSCPNYENYSPCVCSYITNLGYSITCEGVSLLDISDAFNRTTGADLYFVDLYLSAFDASPENGEIMIPSDLLGYRHSAAKIYLNGPRRLLRNYFLKMDPNAFRSSKDMAQTFGISDFDIGRLDFNYLSGFGKLSCLTFGALSNVGLADWTSLPPLPSLNNLDFSESPDLNDWAIFPRLTRGLEIMSLSYNEIRDSPMENILNWVISNSANTLQSLDIYGNNLTNIPRQMSSFSNLIEINVAFQKTKNLSISTGSFSLSSQVSRIDAQYCGIENIEPGAFQGNFIVVIITLYVFILHTLSKFQEITVAELLSCPLMR